MTPGAKSKSITRIEGAHRALAHVDTVTCEFTQSVRKQYAHRKLKSLFDMSTKASFFLHLHVWFRTRLSILYHTRVTSSLKTPPSVNPPSVNDVADPGWKSLSPTVFCFIHCPCLDAGGKGVCRGGKADVSVRMNSALRGRREIAGIVSTPWRPTRARQGSVSKRNQLVLGFWMTHTHTRSTGILIQRKPNGKPLESCTAVVFCYTGRKKNLVVEALW